MMQADVLAILRASPAPMTVIEIMEAGDGTRSRQWMRRSLKSLERYKLIRKTGKRESDDVPGAYYDLWEATV